MDLREAHSSERRAGTALDFFVLFGALEVACVLRELEASALQ